MSSSHIEHRKENSLTAPSDRDPARIYEPNQGHPALTEDEVKAALGELNNNDFVSRFPSVERRYADPVDSMQRIGLISFVPAKGATPNEHGIYGFAKLRGNYPTDREASEKAEMLIRNVDSYHQIYHAYVGRPFPLTTTSKFSADTTEIDIKKTTSESVSANIKNKKDEERQAIKGIEEREEQLLEESKREDKDPMDHYITLRVKKAQVVWTYLETEKKLQDMREIIIKTRKEIETMDLETPEYKEQYFEKYKKARQESGLDNQQHQDNFMKFLVEDVKLDF